MFVPLLDIHLNALRVDYWGQRLFLLVKHPRERSAMDNIYWRVPGVYQFGIERGIYEMDQGDWRLFEVISAPRRRPDQPPQTD